MKSTISHVTFKQAPIFLAATVCAGITLLGLGLPALMRAESASAPLPTRSAVEWRAVAGEVPAKLTTADMPAASRQRIREAYAKLPLSFVPNRGQWQPQVRYYTKAAGCGVYFTPEAAVFTCAGSAPGGSDAGVLLPAALRSGDESGADSAAQGVFLALQFLGASPRVQVEAQREGVSKVNYLVGSDPQQWHTGLPTYAEIRYRELWPGVDLVYRGTDGQLKYEFVLQPGVPVQSIRLAYRGALCLCLDAAGNLRIPTTLGMLVDEHPVSYQEVDGRRVPVESHFVLQGDSKRRTYGFAVGEGYDPRYPLIIDPTITARYLGGSGDDIGQDIAVGVDNSIYVTGRTGSLNFPGVSGTNAGNGDVFVTKLFSDLSLSYTTILGGSGTDTGYSLAVDSAGYIYVTGQTDSANFPAQGTQFLANGGGGANAFVAKLNPGGSSFAFCARLGGSGTEGAYGIAVDASSNVYVAGQTSSTDFPTTPGGLVRGGDSDGFVTKLQADGNGLIFSTYLGGSAGDMACDIAVDGSGNAFVGGQTTSTNFPVSAGAFQSTLSPARNQSDAFVARLNFDPAYVITDRYRGTYLGGRDSEVLTLTSTGIAVDGGGVYLAGATFSSDFPMNATVAGFDRTWGAHGSNDGFLARLNSDLTTLLYATYVGGSGNDQGMSVAADETSLGTVWVTGNTDSRDFPTTDATAPNRSDAFAIKLNTNVAGASGRLFATVIGGRDYEAGRSVAARGGIAYVTGQTYSNDFPATPGLGSPFGGGNTDAFVARIVP